MPTWQLALIIWLVAGVTIAGAAVAVVLAVPQFEAQSAVLIPAVAAAGFVVAFLASIVVARKINPGKA